MDFAGAETGQLKLEDDQRHPECQNGKGKGGQDAINAMAKRVQREDQNGGACVEGISGATKQS